MDSERNAGSTGTAVRGEHDPIVNMARQIAGMNARERARLSQTLAAFEGGEQGKVAQQESTNQHARGYFAGETADHLGLMGYDAQELGLQNIDDAFRYQPWAQEQTIRGDAVREALVFAAKVILRNVPRSPLRTRALNCLIDGRMLCNAGITFGGRF